MRKGKGKVQDLFGKTIKDKGHQGLIGSNRGSRVIKKFFVSGEKGGGWVSWKSR